MASFILRRPATRLSRQVEYDKSFRASRFVADADFQRAAGHRGERRGAGRRARAASAVVAGERFAAVAAIRLRAGADLAGPRPAGHFRADLRTLGRSGCLATGRAGAVLRRAWRAEA